MEQPYRIDVGYCLRRSGLLTEYAAELSRLEEICTQRLFAFPFCLQKVGKALLQHYARRWRGVEWVQPLVLSTAWAVPAASRQAVAVANAMTTMHAHIQREAIDVSPRHSREQLPLGSLLYTQVLRQYQQLFLPNSCFWRLLEGYYLEWAEAVLWEQQRKWGRVRRYSREETFRQAGIRALLKISGAAIALLSGNQQIITPLSSVLDQVHVALQLVDGIVNWREDLRAQRATYFLTEVALALNVREMDNLCRSNVKEFLGTGVSLDKVIKRAMKHLLAAKKVASRLNAPALSTYLDKLEAACLQIPCQGNCDLGASSTTLEPLPASVPS